MKQIQYAMAAIFDAASSANCRIKPAVTLTFDTRGDRYRFETAMRRDFDPLLAATAMQGHPPGEFEVEGIVFKLAVRQVDAS